MSKSFSKRLRWFVLALFSCVLSASLVFGLSACGSSDKNKAEMTLGLNHISYTMAPTERDTLEIFVTQSDGKEYSGEYVWYSSDESIVKATENKNVCIVEAVSVGTARVTCEVGNYSVFCTYNIVEVTDISFDPESLEVEVGSEESLKVTVSMSDNTSSSDFTYGLSGDEGVVEISKSDSTLMVKGLKEGTTTLTVTAGGKTASCDITVVEAKSETHDHIYGEPQWTWSSDYSTADAVFTCTDVNCPDEDGNKTVTLTADVKVSEEGYKAATCGESGSCRFVATVEFEGGTYTDTTADIEIPATGLHTAPDENDTINVVWTWNTSSSVPTASVKITCSVCGGTLYGGTAQVSPIDDGYVNPGCETTGTQYYEGTVSFVLTDGTQCSYTDKAFVTLDPLGHTYPDPQTQGDLYHWTFPGGEISVGTEVTITAECVVCHQTIATFTTTVASVDTVDATAESNGKITYTAVVQIDGQDVTLTFIEILTAEGHTYPGDYDTTYVVWGWENMDTQNNTVSYAIYCADGDSFLLTEGTATYSCTTTNPTCEVAGSTVYTVSVTVTADGTAHTYSGTYSVEIPAIGHSWTANFDWSGITDIKETESGTVQVTLTCSACGTSETHEATYTRTEYVASTCNDAGHMTFTATLNVEGVDEPFTSSTTVTLPLSEEHTYPEDGTSNVVWDWGNRDVVNNTVKLTVYCTVCGKAVIENYEVEYATDQSGTYWVATYSDGTHEYTSSYLIPQDEETDVVVEVDFTDGSFETSQTFVEESTSDPKVAPGDATVVDKDGNETGFTAIGTADNSKTINIATNGGYTALKFDGTIDSTKNSVSYTLQEGTYTVKISYINTSNAGRWATVKAYVEGVFTDLGAIIAEEEKTSGSDLKTREITFTLTEETTIYIGSYNAGLYITFIGIYTSEPAETLTPAGVNLSVDETLSLAVGDEVEISAYVVMSDGKTYASYPEVQFNWTISPSGIVSESGSGNSRSISGLAAGDVTVTVTIEGYDYSVSCTIIVVEVYVPTLGDVKSSAGVDFSDPDSYSWIMLGTQGEYTSGVLTFHIGTGSMTLDENGGYLTTGGTVSTGNGRYFTVDLSDCIGDYVTITTTFTDTGSNGRSMLVSTALDTEITGSGVLKYATTQNTSDKATLIYAAEISEDNSHLYISSTGSVRLYTVSVVVNEIIDDSEPTVTGVTLSRSSMVINVGDDVELTATVTMNKGEYTDGYEWTVTGDTTSIQATDSTTGSTYLFAAVGEGNVTITVTAGGESASCTVKILAEGESAYEWVETSADFSSAAAQAGGTGSGNKNHGGISEGKFYFSDGSYFEDTSSGISGAWDVNTQGKDITFTVSGTENNVSFNIQSASGSGDLITVSIYSSTDTENVLYSLGVTSFVSVDYYSAVGSYLPAGTYVIHTSSSARISELMVSEYVEISDPDSLEVVATNVDFLYGRAISDSDLGLVITLVYQNGRRDALSSSQVTTDLSTAQNNFKVGANTVRVTYNYDGTEYYADIVIYLYEVESITVSDFSMSYTGGTYYTNNVQKIFLLGDSFNHDYAAVTATAYSYDENGNKISATFILTDAEVIFTLYDPNGKETSYLDEEGVYTVKISVDMSVVLGDSPETEYTVSVVDKTGADITTVYVEKDAKAELINGYFTVGSINDAIQIIKLLGASDKERKFIYVGAGQYWEKIYIDIPNLSLIGSNSPDKDKLATRQDSTTGGTEIVFWAMNGLMDPSGTTTYSTVGGATVTVAEQAVGFYAANITFRNYWNTNDLYNQALKITSATQADAAYINADQSYFYNVTFTGYHDTLEAENGRQVYDHCYIEGRTDYIFGNTATCYFTDCTIHTIGSGSSTNGGYVMAIKGGTDDKHVDYGYIFNGCDFITDLESYYKDESGNESVPYEGFAYTVEGTVSVARTWSGNNMHIAILNSTFDKGFSTKEYGDTTTDNKNARYTIMSAGEYPTKEYLIEYNNKGDGAISDTNYGTCTIITDAEVAAAYLDMDTIFADVNGGITYTDGAWDGKCEVIEITVMDSSGETVTTVYATGSMSVSDLKDAINLRLPDNDVEAIFTDSNMTKELTGSVAETTTVYISLGEKDMSVDQTIYYDFSTSAYGESVSESGYLDSNQWLYLDCGDAGSLTLHNGSYYRLVDGATLSLLLKAGTVLGVGVFANDGSLVVTGPDGNAVEGTFSTESSSNNYAFSYTVENDGVYTISQGTGTLYLIYVNVMIPVTESMTIYYENDLSGVTIQKCYAWYGYAYVDATAEGAKFTLRGTDAQVNAGTIIYIQSVPGATVSVKYYQAPVNDDDLVITVSDSGLITIAYGSNYSDYIYSITINVPEDDKIYQIGDSIDLSFIESAIQGTVVVNNGVTFDCTSGKIEPNGNNWHITEGTVITIQSVPGATAEINYYSAQYADAATIEVNADGLITITFTASETYIFGITIISDDSFEELPGEGQEDEYTGSITLTETEITVTVGETGNIEFEYEVLENGETYEGTIDIAVESDDTYIAVDSWDGTSNTIVVKGVNKGDTVVIITLSVNGKVLDTVSVTIHVEATAEEPQITTKEYSFSYKELCDEAFGVDGTVTDKSALDADYFTGSNAFLTYTGSYSKDWSGSGDPADNIRTSSCIEVKGGVLQVTFEGTGTISISFASTGTTNISTLGIKNEAGYYLQGILDETSSGYSNTTELTITNNGGYYYKVTNTSYVTVEFVITEPGTYTIATSMEATVLKLESSDDNRASRINSIVMIDNVVSDGTTSEDNPFEHTYPETNDTVHVVWDWEDRTETSDTTGNVTVTIICVDCGETIVSESTTYVVDENNQSYWYAEVAEGNTTYSSLYRIPGEGSAYIEDSFIVSMTADGATATNESFDSGDTIVSNSLFTVTAMDSFKYHIGGSYGNLQNTSHPVSFTDMSGITHNPDQGLESGSDIGPTYNETTEEWEEAYKDEIIKIEASQNITLYVYLTLANDSYNSQRTGTIYYSVNGGDKVSVSVEKRETVVTFEISLTAGDVVVIGASNSTTSTNSDTGVTSAQNARLWFFGAEAFTTGAEKIEYGVEYTVTFNTNQESVGEIKTAVYNYSVVTAPVLPNVTGYYFAGWYMNEKCTAAYDFSEPVTCDLQLYAKWVTLDSEITYIEGAYESIAFEFEDTDASGAKIYYKLVSDSSYTLMNDPDAVRQFDTETVRVDIIGLQGGEYYNVKILTSGNAELACYSIYVTSYDRSGYAHFGYDEGVGAYEDDGTLKNGALVIYLSEDNKNDVTNDMYVYDKATDSYNQVTLADEKLLSCLTVTNSNDIATYFPNGGDCIIKGIGEILNTRRYSSRMSYGIGMLCQTYGAVVIRVVGTVTATVGEFTTVSYTDSKGVISDIQVASYDIIGISDYNYTTNGGSVGDNGGMASMTNAHNVTIEGVGEGATIDGWGFCFMTANGGYDASTETGVGFEVRNLTFQNYTEDAIGMEGVQAESSDVTSELTCPVERLWIHNNTFYVGYCANPVEEDKADGDGSCDFKRGRYLTVSYNYFEGCHKTNLFGANANSLQFDMTIHHNYYKNCSQRMPLVRNGNVHFYNNYIYSDDGNMQSAVYSRDGAYVYAEYNYFEGCYNPMMAEAKVSDAGSDEAGYIKSYGNVLDGCDGSDQSDIVTSRTQTVENTCNYPFGNVDYSSFDTDPTLFYYDVAMGRSDCYLTSAEQAKKDVIRMAGAFSSGR